MSSYKDPTAEMAIAHVTKQERGLLNRINGEQFEALIEASLLWYENAGLASIEKTPEPIKQISKPDSMGHFLACYKKKAQPDFKGTIIGGRSVVFEAKHTDGDQIDFNRVTPKQYEKLDKQHKLGAAAFVVVSFGMSDFYRIPWEIWRDMKDLYGRKYIKQYELDDYRVQYIAGVLKLLEGVERTYNKKS